jgi:hypothetical protein
MTTAPTKVAIIGGDPIVGEALEVLLQAAGYRTRFLPETVMDEILMGELLADSQLLLVAPVLSAKRRKALLERKLGPTTPVNIPVLELLPANGGQHFQGGRTVLWPCSGEELKRAIDALLLDRGGSDPA